MSIDNNEPADENGIVSIKIQTYQDKSGSIKNQNDMDDFIKFCENNRSKEYKSSIDDIKVIIKLD